MAAQRARAVLKPGRGCGAGSAADWAGGDLDVPVVPYLDHLGLTVAVPEYRFGPLLTLEADAFDFEGSAPGLDRL